MSMQPGDRISRQEAEADRELTEDPLAARLPADRTSDSRSLVAVLAGALTISSVLLVVVSAFALMAGDAGAGQPVATVIGGAGVLSAGVLTFRAAHQTRVSTANAATASLEHARRVAADERKDAHERLLAQREQSDLLLAAQAKASAQVHQREVIRDLRLRYTTAAEQLAHASSAVRLAGVYGLASLADDWQQQGDTGEKQVSIDLLRAYLRTPNSTTPYASAGGAALNGARSGEQEVRKSILLTLLGRCSRQASESKSWRLSSCDVNGADLRGLNLEGTDLRSANLADADLTRSNLKAARLYNCNLSRSTLTEAILTKADLSDARLTEVDAHGAHLSRADLQMASILFTDLSASDFRQATLSHAYMDEVEFTGANFHGADLSYAHLSGSVLNRANFDRADLRGVVLAN